MSISLDQKLLISSLIPKSLIDGLESEKEEEKQGEAPMCATVLLIVNIALGAIKALEECDYKRLDANPGDGGCQSRAFELRRLIMMDLSQECSELKKTVLEIKNLVNKRKGSLKDRLKSSSQSFFRTHLRSITISREMEFIFHCYLSAVLRTPYQTLTNGVIMTRSEVNKLSKLSKDIGVVDTVSRRKIMEHNQNILSCLSVSAMHAAATQIISLEYEEKELIVTMLSAEHTHIFTPDIKYEPKAFGCFFYVVKTVLVRLQEEKGIVCLKSVVATGEPFHLLLQPQAASNAFELLSDEACISLLPMTAIVVFEAVVQVDKKMTSQLLMEQGFTNTILAQAAKEPPYEPASTLDDVKEPRAVEEITTVKEKSVSMPNFMTLDHVYLTTLGAELKK